MMTTMTTQSTTITDADQFSDRVKDILGLAQLSTVERQVKQTIIGHVIALLDHHWPQIKRFCDASPENKQALVFANVIDWTSKAPKVSTRIGYGMKPIRETLEDELDDPEQQWMPGISEPLTVAPPVEPPEPASPAAPLEPAPPIDPVPAGVLEHEGWQQPESPAPVQATTPKRRGRPPKSAVNPAVL
jgi:hypothetical protein